MKTTFPTVALAQRLHRPARSQGFNLIELMIALVLGLLVVGGAISIFIANQQTYAATESLGRIQENTRTAFELMARELREAGGNPCGKTLPAPANVLNGAGGNWWGNWGLGAGSGLIGYDAGAPLTPPLLPASGLGSQIAGTDAFDILSAAGSGITVTSGNPVSASMQLNTVNHGFVEGDILLVCDLSQAAIFEMTGPNSPPGTNDVVDHNQGGSVAPGNCTQRLGLPSDCGPRGQIHMFGANSNVARLSASRWYIGNTNRPHPVTGVVGRALFRSAFRRGTLVNEEVAEGVTNMQATYLLPGAGAYVPANPGLAWNLVTAVNITLTLAGQAQGETQVSTTGGALQRQVNFVVTLRNRSI
jgi:type IV pilus assembly protein PilW